VVLCVESYIGAETGGEGVKLEQQVLLTSQGPELLSAFPFEQSLLARTDGARPPWPSRRCHRDAARRP
jgi:hypothetical protein